MIYSIFGKLWELGRTVARLAKNWISKISGQVRSPCFAGPWLSLRRSLPPSPDEALGPGSRRPGSDRRPGPSRAYPAPSPAYSQAQGCWVSES